MGRALLSLTGIRIAGMVLVLAYNVLLARWAGPEAFGLVALYANVCVYGAILLSGGLEAAMVRFGSIAWASGDVSGFAAIYRQAAHVVLLRALLLAAVVAVLMLGGVATPLTATPLLVGLTVAGIVLCAFNAIHRDVLRAAGRLAAALVSASLVRTALPLVLFVVFASQWALDPAANVILYAAVLLVGLAFELWQVRPHLGIGPATDTRAARAERLAYANRVFAGDVAHVAVYKLPGLAIGFLFDLQTAALFFAAERYAALSQFVTEGVQLAAGRDAALRFAQGDRQAMQEMVSRVSLYALLSGIPVGLGLAAAGGLLLGLFGPVFVAAYPVLLCLLAGYAALSVFGPTPALCSLAGIERERAVASYVALAVTAVTVIVAAANASPLQAAVGVSIALWLLHGLAALILWRRLGVVAGVAGVRMRHVVDVTSRLRQLRPGEISAR